MEEHKIKIEHWEGDEYVISIHGIGIVGHTLHKKEAVVIQHWLNVALPEILYEKGS